MSQAARQIPLDRIPWWLWPTVLCLDAPAVVLSWQRLFALEAGLRPAFHHAALLALGVWLAYAADRWIEGWRLTSETVRTRRHFFYMRRRWPAFAVWLAALFAGVALAFATLSVREWLGSLALLVVVLLYLFSHQWLHRHHPARVPKEVCVAVLIACGAAFYPAMAQPGRWVDMFPAFVWLAVLGVLNCLLISEWEREVDLSQGQSSLALTTASVRGMTRVLPAAATLCALVFAGFGPTAARRASVAGALGAGALALLAKTQPRLGRERARVLADAALLSPLVVILFSP